MNKIPEELKNDLTQLDIELIESFDDDLGWLMLDLSDDEKEKEIERNRKHGQKVH